MLSDILHRVYLPPKVSNNGESSQGNIRHEGGEEGGGGVGVTRGGVGGTGPNLCYRYHDITPSGTVTSKKQKFAKLQNSKTTQSQ